MSESRPELVAFASWLREAMAARGVSVRELGRRLGVSQTAVSEWTRGVRPPSLPNVLALGLFFGVPSDRLLGLLPGSQETAPAITLPGALSVITIPVFSQRAMATETGRGAEEVTTYVTVVPPPGASKALFGLRAEGDSMEPALHSGQLVIVDQEASPRVGKIVVARPKGEWLIKRCTGRTNGTLILTSDNVSFPGEWRIDEHEIVGVALQAIVDL